MRGTSLRTHDRSNTAGRERDEPRVRAGRSPRCWRARRLSAYGTTSGASSSERERADDLGERRTDAGAHADQRRDVDRDPHRHGVFRTTRVVTGLLPTARSVWCRAGRMRSQRGGRPDAVDGIVDDHRQSLPRAVAVGDEPATVVRCRASRVATRCASVSARVRPPRSHRNVALRHEWRVGTDGRPISSTSSDAP